MSSSGRWQKLFFLTGFAGADVGSDLASVAASATLLSGAIDDAFDTFDAIDARDMVETAPAVSKDVVLAEVDAREVAPRDVTL